MAKTIAWSGPRILAPVLVALCVFPPSVGDAADKPFSLSGIWHAPFTLEQGVKDEQVQIVQQGNYFSAIKITGDQYVPAGTMNFRARYTGKHFPGEQRCALGSSGYLFWDAVKVTIIDKDHFKVEGGCSADPAIWTREGAPIS